MFIRSGSLRFNDLLSIESVPPSGMPANYADFWFGRDNADAYRSNGGHAIYSAADIKYQLNSNGYRAPEFERTAGLRVLSLGCSWSFGLGLPQEVIFHELIAASLRTVIPTKVTNWNLGIPGASNDLIARLTHLAIPILDPHLILVLFTYPSRREVVTSDGIRFNFSPSRSGGNRVEKEVGDHLEAIGNRFDDSLNLFRNYKAVEARASEAEWAFSFTFPKHLGLIERHLDSSAFAEPMKPIDTARDHSHPGPESHRLLAANYWEILTSTGALSRLRKKVMVDS